MAAAVLALLALSGCDRGGAASGGGKDPAKADAEAVEEKSAPVGTLPQGVSAEAGAEGRRLYARACIMCHGETGQGTQLAPSLADATWLQGRTGTYEEITQVVRDGLAKSDSFPVPMSPRGDGTFTDDQVRAVAAYTYSLGKR